MLKNVKHILPEQKCICSRESFVKELCYILMKEPLCVWFPHAASLYTILNHNLWDALHTADLQDLIPVQQQLQGNHICYL